MPDTLCVIIFCALFWPSRSDFPFRNTSLSWDVRVDDLVSRLTIDEIILQLAKGGAGEKGGPAPAIDRLGIKPYQWNTECLRGDAAAPGNATSFPQAIGLAAAFSPMLIYNVSQATGIEVRAKHNYFMNKEIYQDHTGISCFSPVINIMRHPLWGRNQETYGEDPYLSGLYAQHYVTGLQGDHPRYIRANAGCKHFDVHGGPENIPVSRFSFDAKVSERDWRTTFLPQFKMCVEAGTYSVMCSYNSINGIPACANKKLLTDILRTEWGFKGYVVSDEGALEFIISDHKYLNNSVVTAAACINAGTNLELSSNNAQAVYLSMSKALSIGLVTEQTILDRVKPLFYTRMRHGEFDPPDMNPYTKLDLSVIQSPEHKAIAIEAAVKSFVLLKNMDNFLPLKNKTFNSISIVGPMAHNPLEYFGDYSAVFDPTNTMTPKEAFNTTTKVLHYEAGCKDTRCPTYDVAAIMHAVKDGSELAVVCLGTGNSIASENHDRVDMRLPGKQEDLLRTVLDVADLYKTPVILLLFSAGPLEIADFVNRPQLKAIFECFYPAQGTGEALLRVIWKQHSGDNPAGRLPMTWPLSMSQVPPMTDYTMTGRTYRYFKEEPLYPFGYGLSYTYFNYDKLTITPEILVAGDDVTVEVTVSNVGQYDGDEVVQVYLEWPVSSLIPSPQWQLVGFDRVHLITNDNTYSGGLPTTTVKFIIRAEQMALWDDSQGFMVHSGEMTIYAGGQQPNQFKSVGSHVLKGHFQVKGNSKLS